MKKQQPKPMKPELGRAVVDKHGELIMCKVHGLDAWALAVDTRAQARAVLAIPGGFPGDHIERVEIRKVPR